MGLKQNPKDKKQNSNKFQYSNLEIPNILFQRFKTFERVRLPV
jgi:hypothetical protein